MGRPPRTIDLTEAERLRTEGRTWQDVAIQLGVGRNTLCDHRRKALLLRGEIDTKRCGGPCQLILPVNRFSIDNSRSDRRNAKCRKCVSDIWKKKNESPCVKCGRPRSSLMPGQCRFCYEIRSRIETAECAILVLIPNLITRAQRKNKEIVKTISERTNLSPSARLQMLLEKVMDGTQRNINA